MLLGPRLGSCFGRMWLYSAALVVGAVDVMVAGAAVGGRFVGGAGVAGVEAADGYRDAVGRRRPVPVAAAAVVARLSVHHSHALHS